MNEEATNMNQNMEPNEESSVGPIIGTIIILAVIVLGGLYFWGQRTASQPALTDEQVQEQVNMIQNQNTSDTPADIEADLNATDINNIDSQLDVQ